MPSWIFATLGHRASTQIRKKYNGNVQTQKTFTVNSSELKYRGSFLVSKQLASTLKTDKTKKRVHTLIFTTMYH